MASADRQLRAGALDAPPDGRITGRGSKLTQDFMFKIGALNVPVPFDQVVTHELLPK